MILFRSKPIRKPLLTLTGTKAEPSPRVYVSQKITNHNSLSQTIPTNCMYHIKWTLTSTSRSTDIHTNPDLSTYLTTDRVTLDRLGNLQKKIVITSKLGFELVGIYRALFFLVQDLQFALRRAGQNPTDVEVALCQVLEKGKI